MAAEATGRRKARLALATCCGAHALHDGLTDVLYVLLPVLAQAFGLNYTQIGVVRSAYRAAITIFQIPAGIIAERMGERGLLALGTGFAGLAFVGLGFSGGFIAVLAYLFLAGVGSAFQHPLCSSIVSGAYASGGRRGAIGAYNSAGDVGKFAFTWAVSLLIAAGFSWQGPVLAMGVMGVIGAAGIYLVLLALAVGGGAGEARGEETPPETEGWGIKDRRGFVALCVIGLLEGATRYGFLTFVAFLMIDKGLAPERATVVVPVVLVGGMAGKLACGFLADRIGAVRTILVMVISAGAGMLLLLPAPMTASFALLPAIGVVLNGTSSVLFGIVGEMVEADRQSRAYGVYYTLTVASGVLAPMGYGRLSDGIGVGATMAAAALLIFLAVPFALFLRGSVDRPGAPGDVP